MQHLGLDEKPSCAGPNGFALDYDHLWIPELPSQDPDDLSSSISDWMAGLSPRLQDGKPRCSTAPQEAAATPPAEVAPWELAVMDGFDSPLPGSSISSGTHGSCQGPQGVCQLYAPPNGTQQLQLLPPPQQTRQWMPEAPLQHLPQPLMPQQQPQQPVMMPAMQQPGPLVSGYPTHGGPYPAFSAAPGCHTQPPQAGCSCELQLCYPGMGGPAATPGPVYLPTQQQGHLAAAAGRTGVNSSYDGFPAASASAALPPYQGLPGPDAWLQAPAPTAPQVFGGMDTALYAPGAQQYQHLRPQQLHQLPVEYPPAGGSSGAFMGPGQAYSFSSGFHGFHMQLVDSMHSGHLADMGCSSSFTAHELPLPGQGPLAVGAASASAAAAAGSTARPVQVQLAAGGAAHAAPAQASVGLSTGSAGAAAAAPTALPVKVMPLGTAAARNAAVPDMAAVPTAEAMRQPVVRHASMSSRTSALRPRAGSNSPAAAPAADNGSSLSAKIRKPQATAAAAAAVGLKVQQGAVSKPPRPGSVKAVMSKSAKRKLREAQEQTCMQESSEKIQQLTAKRESLQAALKTMQATSDKAAAALAKLKDAYESVAADNAKLRATNNEIKGIIRALRQQLRLPELEEAGPGDQGAACFSPGRRGTSGVFSA